MKKVRHTKLHFNLSLYRLLLTAGLSLALLSGYTASKIITQTNNDDRVPITVCSSKQ